MDCTDFFDQLNSQDRSEAWNIFMKITSVFIKASKMEKDVNDLPINYDFINEYKIYAQQYNDLLIKNALPKYFNINLSDIDFYDMLINELNIIKQKPRKKD